MSRWLSPLRLELVDEFENIHELLAPLVYQSDMLGRTVEVPASFRTDLASVPRVVGAYLLFGGKGARASVLHDYAYSGGLAVTRDLADNLFREALLASGYSAVTAWAMYRGVRWGGASRFNEPNLQQPAEVFEVMEAP